MKPGKGKKTTPITSHYNQEKPHSPSESSMRTRGNAYHPDEEDLVQNSDSITQQPENSTAIFLHPEHENNNA